MPNSAIVAATAPFKVEVEEGKSYFWCACGRSARQPFCDGSHRDTGLSPVRWTAESSRTVFFCGCKQTARAPMCDGSHKSL
ncbi:MAG: CDGSH iron-sulfur domain-containing protein [Tabrizicola sp.]